jgi:hypothetical protein
MGGVLCEGREAGVTDDSDGEGYAIALAYYGDGRLMLVADSEYYHRYRMGYGPLCG